MNWWQILKTVHTVGQYQIDSYKDETFAKGSAENLHTYDIEHFDESEYIFPTMFGIKVFKDNILLTSAIVETIPRQLFF